MEKFWELLCSEMRRIAMRSPDRPVGTLRQSTIASGRLRTSFFAQFFHLGDFTFWDFGDFTFDVGDFTFDFGDSTFGDFVVDRLSKD